MLCIRHSTLLSALLLAAIPAVLAQANDYAKPNVRAVTAFVRVDPAAPAQEIDPALAVLRALRDEFGKRGYQVQTLRVVTQPLAEFASGRSDAEALALLKTLDALAARDGLVVNVGPAMLRDADDPRAMRVLAQALSSLERISG